MIQNIENYNAIKNNRLAKFEKKWLGISEDAIVNDFVNRYLNHPFTESC